MFKKKNKQKMDSPAEILERILACEYLNLRGMGH